MNLSDYEAVWKRQTPPVGASADLTTLKETFDKKSRKLAAKLMVRDYLEASACIYIIITHARIWYRMGSSGWPMVFSIGIMAALTVFFLRERMRAHRQSLNHEMPILSKIIADLVEMRHQRRLLLTVWAWYLGPIAVAMFISFSVRHHIDPAHGRPHYLPFLITSAPLFLFVWWLNRRAVRKTIEPRIAELEKLQRDLQGSD